MMSVFYAGQTGFLMHCLASDVSTQVAMGKDDVANLKAAIPRPAAAAAAVEVKDPAAALFAIA